MELDEWLNKLEEGNEVFVCVFTRQEKILRLRGIVAQVVGEEIYVTTYLDEPRPLNFDRSSGKQIGDNMFWIEQNESADL